MAATKKLETVVEEKSEQLESLMQGFVSDIHW